MTKFFDFFFFQIEEAQRVWTNDTCSFSQYRKNSAVSGQPEVKYLTQGRGRYGGWPFIPKQGYRSPKVFTMI